MPKISIIVPIYNVSRYLKKCLTTIEQQTFRDFEVIMVNDGSTDTSEKICQTFCERDNRFILFTIQNRGVSNARNFGIDKSSGKYICFVDGDDYLEKDFLLELLTGIDENDVGFCRFYLDEKDRSIKYFETKLVDLVKSPSRLDLFIVDTLFDLTEESTLKRDCIFGSCWRCIFKKSIIVEHSLKFNNDLILGEDLVFVMSYLLYCQSCYLVDKYLYHYVVRNESATSKNTKGYNAKFWDVYYPLYLAQKKILLSFNADNQKQNTINYLTYQFQYRLVVNDCILGNKRNFRYLRRKLKVNKCKFSLKRLFGSFNFTFKEKILCTFIKLRLFYLISKILRK